MRKKWQPRHPAEFDIGGHITPSAPTGPLPVVSGQIPEHELKAAKVDAFLATQGIILTAWQRQWLEAMFARKG